MVIWKARERQEELCQREKNFVKELRKRNRRERERKRMKEGKWISCRKSVHSLLLVTSESEEERERERERREKWEKEER